MENLTPPYILLSNHMHFIDFELVAIATRKFTMDLHLVKSIRHVLQKGDVLGLYPEAGYSPCGVTAKSAVTYDPEADTYTGTDQEDDTG